MTWDHHTILRQICIFSRQQPSTHKSVAVMARQRVSAKGIAMDLDNAVESYGKVHVTAGG